MRSDDTISIWFFIGISLLVNGLLILGTGIYEYSHPPAHQVVLFNLHANIWWGALLALVGAFYCFRFLPGRSATPGA
jgi:hypothetical protein